MNLPKKITREIILSIIIKGLIGSTVMIVFSIYFTIPFGFFIKVVENTIMIGAMMFFVILMGAIMMLPSWVFDPL